MAPPPSPRRADAPGPPEPANPASAETAPVFDSLRRLVHTLHSASRESERRLGLTSAQLFVLTHLRASPLLSVNELAERTMTHQSTVSVVVQRLVERRLVRKARSPGDARRVELSLTPAGGALLRRAPEAIQVRLARAIDELDPARRRALARGLSELVGRLGADDGAEAMFFEE